MIYILTGNIRSGKTTALLNWSKNRLDVDGVLCPDDDFGKRYFLELKSKKTIPLEVDSNSGLELSTVGSFQFSKVAFNKAKAYLLAASKETDSKYLIVDELGKLELNEEGLHEVAERLISNLMFDHQRHLILVVRGTLVSDVLNHYKIQNYKLVSKVDLAKKSFT